MKKLTGLIGMVVLLALLLSACSVAVPSVSGQSGGDEVNEMEVPDEEGNVGGEVNEKGIVVISPGIQGASAKVKVGDIVEVRIPTIPSEGYQWMPDRLDTNALEQIGLAEYTADTAADAAGGIVALRFKALAVGTVNVTLVYTNAGSGKDPAFTKNTFGFELTIE